MGWIPLFGDVSKTKAHQIKHVLLRFVFKSPLKDYVAEAWHNELPPAACEIISAGRVPTNAQLVPLQSETASPTFKEECGVTNKYFCCWIEFLLGADYERENSFGLILLCN